MLKDAVKLILKLNGSVKVSFKSEISDWYGEYIIYRYVDNKKIESFNISPDGSKFYDIDQAVNYFCETCFTSKNVGIVQRRLMEKGHNLEDRLEEPDEEILKLFEEESKLVDDEYTRLYQ